MVTLFKYETTVSKIPMCLILISFSEQLNIQLIQRKRKPREFIELKIGIVHIKNKSVENDEAYNLKVDPQEKAITITGNTPKGVFWGIQSLLSIMNNGEVPWLAVEDCPRYEYRGLSIDVARNFLPKVEVMRILDGMAMYKMNKLHLHLTDDEGWRLEIPGLPELTEVGPLNYRGYFERNKHPTFYLRNYKCNYLLKL